MRQKSDHNKELEDVSPGMNKELLFAIGLILISFMGWGTYVWSCWDNTMDKKGQLGDAFGPLTSFFSAITFFYFVYNIELQRRQLVYQKKDFNLHLKELNETRQELKKPSVAQQKSEKALRLQIEKQTLSTLLSSYTSRFNTLVNNANTLYVHLLFHEGGDLTHELSKLKVRLEAIENLPEQDLDKQEERENTLKNYHYYKWVKQFLII